QVTYGFDTKPTFIGNCHCTDCKRASGAEMTTWMVVPETDFTVLSGVTEGMPAFDEETFGPVAALTHVPDIDSAVRAANASQFGLSSNLWTRDVDLACRVARDLDTGGVFINGFTSTDPRVPVGGVKNSGYGRELSHFGAHAFVNAQTVWIEAA